MRRKREFVSGPYFTPQRPIKRALEQDPAKVRTWLEETWPQVLVRGQVAFQIVEGSINAERFIGFLELLLRDAQQQIFLVVDNLRAHHAKKVTQWLADKRDRIELVFLPPHAPESNPDE